MLGHGPLPGFMKHPSNKIMQSNQATPGVEGYVFDGVDGSQMAFWTCNQDAASSEHVHDYDEYMLVVQGTYILIINEVRIPVRAGEEYLIPRGVPHSGEVTGETRTIHAFGGHRLAECEPQNKAQLLINAESVPRCRHWCLVGFSPVDIRWRGRAGYKHGPSNTT